MEKSQKSLEEKKKYVSLQPVSKEAAQKCSLTILRDHNEVRKKKEISRERMRMRAQ